MIKVVVFVLPCVHVQHWFSTGKGRMVRGGVKEVRGEVGEEGRVELRQEGGRER